MSAMQPVRAVQAAETPFGRAVERLRTLVNNTSSSSFISADFHSTLEELLDVLNGYSKEAFAQQRQVRYVSSAKYGYKDTLLTLPPTVSRFDDNVPVLMGRMGLPELLIRMTGDDRIAKVLNDDNVLLAKLCSVVARLATCSENKAKFLIRDFSRYLEVLIKQTHFEDVKAAAGAALDSMTTRKKTVERAAPEALAAVPLYRTVDGGFSPDISLSLERYHAAREMLTPPQGRSDSSSSSISSNASASPTGALPAPSSVSLANARQEALQRMNQSMLRLRAGTVDDDGETKNIPSFDHLETISAIVDSFDVIESKRPPGNSLVAINVLSRVAAFSKLCDADMLRLFRSADVCQRVADTVKRFSSTGDVVRAGIESVANLSVDSEMGQTFGKLGMCETIALTLVRFGKSSKPMAIYCCAAISNLSLNNDDNKKRFRHSGVNEAVVGVLLAHGRSYSVERWACRAVANLAHGSDENRFELGSKMACESILRVLERCLGRFRDGGAFERQFKPLSIYGSKEEREEAEAAENKKREEDITHLLRIFPAEPLLLTQHIALAMAALKCVCHGSLANAARLTRAGAIEVVQQVLSRHLHYRNAHALNGVPTALLEDIILSCVCCLRYILSRDSSELRNATQQTQAVGIVELLVAAVSGDCATSNPYIAKYSLWAMARLAAPIRKRKQYKAKDILTAVELEDFRTLGVTFDDPQTLPCDTFSRSDSHSIAGSSYCKDDDISLGSDFDVRSDGEGSVPGSMGELSGLSAAGGDIRSELRAAGACEALCRCIGVYVSRAGELYGDIARSRGTLDSPSKLLAKFDAIKALPAEKKIKVLRSYHDVTTVGLKTIQSLCAKSRNSKRRFSDIRVNDLFDAIQTLLDRQMAPPEMQKLLSITKQRIQIL